MDLCIVWKKRGREQDYRITLVCFVCLFFLIIFFLNLFYSHAVLATLSLITGVHGGKGVWGKGWERKRGENKRGKIIPKIKKK